MTCRIFSSQTPNYPHFAMKNRLDSLLRPPINFWIMRIIASLNATTMTLALLLMCCASLAVADDNPLQNPFAHVSEGNNGPQKERHLASLELELLGRWIDNLTLDFYYFSPTGFVRQDLHGGYVSGTYTVVKTNYKLRRIFLKITDTTGINNPPYFRRCQFSYAEGENRMDLRDSRDLNDLKSKETGRTLSFVSEDQSPKNLHR